MRDLPKKNTNQPDTTSYEKVITADGSVTYRSPFYNECFHSTIGAEIEALEKFARPSLIDTGLIKTNAIKVLDIGFGLGYNACATLALADKHRTHLSLISVEHDATTLALARSIHENSDSPLLKDYINNITTEKSFLNNTITAKLIIDDARTLMLSHSHNAYYHAIYLDAFSSRKNPELWTVDFIKTLKKSLHPDGVIVTYASAHAVVSAMEEAGLYLRETKPIGRANGGIIASKKQYTLWNPLSQQREKERIATTGTLVYRDPTLSSTPQTILAHYEKERERYLAEGGTSISMYRKRKKSAENV